VLFPFDKQGLPAAAPSLPAMLKRAATPYHSYFIGKWHLVRLGSFASRPRCSLSPALR
jgi:hypothetical protein